MRVINKTGLRHIADERAKQLEKYNWDAENDDQYTYGSLIHAAICYAAEGYFTKDLDIVWPWEDAWWKPGDKIANLSKAGALIAAEIDRLERLKDKEDDKKEV